LAHSLFLAFSSSCHPRDLHSFPTRRSSDLILITEAARGEGGVLVNKEGERYMQRYLPGKMELGPRDILSRAMIQEIKAGRAFERSEEHTSELQSPDHLVCRLLLEKKKDRYR